MSDATPSEPIAEAPKGGFFRRLSPAWLVPLVALGIALGVAYRSYSERGPLIEILFDTGAGMVAGETLVKYKDFNIGLVEKLDFTADLRQVIAEVRLDAEVADYIDDGSQFWLVQAQVGPQGISGLETVLSGAYIAASFDDEKGPRQKRFTALREPPLTPPGQAGTRIVLRASEGGSIAVGAPVLFKQIRVGQVEHVDLGAAGDVVVTAFIDAPNDDRLTTATRFWNASGFSIRLTPAGASLDVDSLASLVRGGIAFDTVTSGGEPVENDHVYRLFPSEDEARVVILNEDPGNALQVMTSFQGSVRGLQVGATVEYRGIPVGEVAEIQAEVIRVEGEPVVSVRSTMTLNPSRFGIPLDEDPQGALLDLLEAGVERGLRAQLVVSNILTGNLIVQLSEIPDPAPASFDRDARPYPELPSAPSVDGGLAATAEGLLARVDSLPIEELMNSITTLMASANRLITDPELQKAPENVGLLIADLRELVQSPAFQDAPDQIDAILASARTLVDDINEQQVAENLSAALQAAADAAKNVDGATQSLPALIDEISALSQELRNLPFENLIESAERILADVEALVESDSFQGLPLRVSDAVEDLRVMLADLVDGGAVDNVNATLASARQIANEVAAARVTETITKTLADAEAAAKNVSTASEDLPELIDSLTALSKRAEALPLEAFVEAGTDTLDTIDGFLSTEGVQSLPPELAASLAELRAVLVELREGGAVENVNRTLASADAAAEAVTAAANELPALVAELNRVAARADAALTSVGPGSEINRDTLRLLRDLRDAAQSVNALVSALERRPNSVLFGR